MCFKNGGGEKLFYFMEAYLKKFQKFSNSLTIHKEKQRKSLCVGGLDTGS